MISKTRIEKYCCEDISKIENYDKSIQARMDSEEHIEQFSRKSESQELG